MRRLRWLIPIITATMALATAMVALGAGPQAPPGEVIISEVMQNPAAVSDTKGEWIELHNRSGAPVSLNGWSISDAVATQTLTASPSLVIPARGFFVLGRSDVISENGGVPVDFRFRFNLNNDRDSVILKDETGQEVDRVDYDQDTGWPDPNGASMMLVRAEADNDLAGNWITATELWAGSAGDFGTPGLANTPDFLPGSGLDNFVYLPFAVK
jgi:uncharacterized protein